MLVQRITKTFYKSLILLISLASFAQVSDIEKLNGMELTEHFNCKMYLPSYDIPKELYSDLESALKKKGYKTSAYEKGKKVIPGEFIAKLKIERSGKIYKECLVQLELFKINGEYPGISDQRLYKRASNRKFPRQTFKGSERCEMALKDLFFSINLCRVK